MPLVVAGTPIGNLGDASPRLKETLAGADLVLCEDTRVTAKLFHAFALPRPPLWAVHAHNEEAQVDAVLERLEKGERVVLVTDAGMPGWSDPGRLVVRAAHARGVQVVVVPGPSSITAAVAASGLPSHEVHFLGFPPRKAGPLRRWLEAKGALDGCLVVLEAGNRTGALLEAIAGVLPDREVAVCRELTKHFEEVVVGPVADLDRGPRQGEVVVVIGPGAPAVEPVARELEPDAGLKAIAQALARRWGVPKGEAYDALVALEATRRDRSS